MNIKYGYYSMDDIKRASSGINMVSEGADSFSMEYMIEQNIRRARYLNYKDDAKEKSGYVYVVPHYASRASHTPYQGNIYTWDEYENEIEYPNNPEGIGCANCRHEIKAYNDRKDLDFVPPDIDDEEFYDNEQKMRYYERQVRKAKHEGDDEKVKQYYKKMLEHSEKNNTPIQLNRTWTIKQDLGKVVKIPKNIDDDAYNVLRLRQVNKNWYGTVLPKYNISQVNLLPNITNESYSIGGKVKVASKYIGGKTKYLIDDIDITNINFLPHNVRTSYTGRAYGIPTPLTADNIMSATQKQLQTKLLYNVVEDGVIKWYETTTERILNCSGAFYIPPGSPVSKSDPTLIYDNYKKYEVEYKQLKNDSYGIYIDDKGIYKFFYGLDDVPKESREIFDYSRVPNKSKIKKELLDTPVVNKGITDIKTKESLTMKNGTV